MKYIFVLASCLISASAIPLSELIPIDQVALSRDLDPFNRLIPTDEVVQVVVKYLEHDEDVRRHYMYCMSDAYKSTFSALQKTHEFKEFADYMGVCGINVRALMLIINDVLGIHYRLKEVQPAEYKVGDGMNRLKQEVETYIPRDKLRALHKNKVLNSGIYAIFMNRLQTKEFQIRLKNLLTSEAYKHMRKTALDHGVTVLPFDHLFEVLRLFTGLEFV